MVNRPHQVFCTIVQPLLLLTMILLLVAPSPAYDWEYLALSGAQSRCIEADDVHDRILVGTFDGFHFLDQATDTWTSRNMFLPVHSIEWSRTLDQRLILGGESAFFYGLIYLSDDLGENSEIVHWSVGGRVSDIAKDDGNYYACTELGEFTFELVRSTDGGESWHALGGYDQSHMTGLAVGPFGDEIYLAGDNGVMLSWDQGESWEHLDNGLPAGQVHCVEAVATGGDVITHAVLASNDAGLYLASSIAWHWDQVLPAACRNLTVIPTFHPWPIGRLDLLAVVTFDSRLLVSQNFGQSWDDETGNLPGTPIDVAYSPFDNGLYVCTAEDGVYRAQQVVTGLDGALPPPATLALHAVPNPFNPRTRLIFTLPVAGAVRLDVYDLSGRWIAVVADRWLPAGHHEFIWQPLDLPSGTYIARITGSTGVQTARLTLLK